MLCWWKRAIDRSTQLSVSMNQSNRGPSLVSHWHFFFFLNISYKRKRQTVPCQHTGIITWIWWIRHIMHLCLHKQMIVNQFIWDNESVSLLPPFASKYIVDGHFIHANWFRHFCTAFNMYKMSFTSIISLLFIFIQFVSNTQNGMMG